MLQKLTKTKERKSIHFYNTVYTGYLLKKKGENKKSTEKHSVLTGMNTDVAGRTD